MAGAQAGCSAAWAKGACNEIIVNTTIATLRICMITLLSNGLAVGGWQLATATTQNGLNRICRFS
jgi:hypothetical protein